VAVLGQRDLERVSVASPRLAPRKEDFRVERTCLSAAPGAPDESETGTGEPSRSQSGEGGKPRSAWRGKSVRQLQPLNVKGKVRELALFLLCTFLIIIIFS
jgi:hypothetical protein